MDGAAARPPVVNGIDLVQAREPYGYDRNTKADRHHSNAGPEVVHLPVRCSQTFRKDHGTVATADEIPRILQSPPGAEHLLRQWIRVVHSASQEIRNGSESDIFPGMPARLEISAEVVLHHRGSKTLTAALPQRGEDPDG